jgi:FkbM family methyltransferase
METNKQFNDWDSTYSAHIEDYLIRQLLPYGNGRYVDVGAFDPVKESNTFILYERGWRGILIEPQPTYVERLRQIRPRDTVVESAVSDFNGTAEMRLWWGTSSIDPSWPIPETTESGNAVGRIEVKVRRLIEILDEHPEIRDNCDLCSIDAE